MKNYTVSITEEGPTGEHKIYRHVSGGSLVDALHKAYLYAAREQFDAGLTSLPSKGHEQFVEHYLGGPHPSEATLDDLPDVLEHYLGGPVPKGVTDAVRENLERSMGAQAQAKDEGDVVETANVLSDPETMAALNEAKDEEGPCGWCGALWSHPVHDDPVSSAGPYEIDGRLQHLHGWSVVGPNGLYRTRVRLGEALGWAREGSKLTGESMYDVRWDDGTRGTYFQFNVEVIS